MKSIQIIKDTITCIGMTMILVCLSATPVFAAKQGNQLRAGADSPGQALTTTIIQDDPISAESSVGQMVFEREPSKTFQSNLVLPTVVPGVEPPAKGVMPVKRLDLSSIVSQIAQATVFVLLFCVASLFVLRKIKADRFFSKSTGGSDLTSSRMHLVGTIRLSGNRCLELVEADGRKLVVLTGPSGESSLLQIDGRSTTGTPGTKQFKREATFSLDAPADSTQPRFAKLGI